MKSGWNIYEMIKKNIPSKEFKSLFLNLYFLMSCFKDIVTFLLHKMVVCTKYQCNQLNTE